MASKKYNLRISKNNEFMYYFFLVDVVEAANI